LRRVATLVARATPPEQVFAAVAEEVGRLLAVDFAILVRYDPPDTLEVVGTWTRTGAPAPTPVGGQLPLGGRNVTTVVYQTGLPARIDYSDVSGVIGRVASRDWGLRSSVGVPVSAESRLWGCIVVAFSGRELRPLPADTERRLASFTELVATAIEISLTTRDGGLLLSVRDDGVGGANPASGSGLAGLADRVEALGGSIDIRSAAGAGTHITVELPLEYELAQGAG